VKISTEKIPTAKILASKTYMKGKQNNNHIENHI